jgi:hypothetical protein
LKQVLLPQKARNTAASTISAVGLKSTCRGNGGRKKNQKFSAIDTKHCEKTEWFKLP